MARPATRILVISDDVVLGNLIALSLQRRGFRAQATDLPLPDAPPSPSTEDPPSLIVIELEKASSDTLAALRRARSHPWGAGLPMIVAARDASAAIAKLGGERAMHPANPDDVGAIVAAAAALLTQSSTADRGPQT